MSAVPFLADSSKEALETLLGIWEQGKVACPINPRLPPGRREEMIQELTQTPIVSKEGLAVLLFTSGSTGMPKIAGISHRALLKSALSVVEALSIERSDRWCLSLPLYHVGGIGIVLRCMLAQATVVFDAKEATLLSLVPTQLYRMLKTNDPGLLAKRAIIVGGAPIPEELLGKGLPLMTTWGMTETSSMMTLSGNVLCKREVKLEGDGEILVRGEVLFEGYLQEDGTLKRPMTQDGWFATKDLGAFEDGKLCIKGRKDRLFIAYGENVHPEEIEEEILKLRGILQAVVVPISDPEIGAFPVAFVNVEGDFHEDEWQHSLKERLSSFKVPRRFFKLEPLLGLKPNLSLLVE
jgi:O-succinylbenzoic acid--CoA ligase